MKARVKTTGEIIEINESSTIYDAGLCHIYNASELESVLDNPDYWTRLEHQFAGMAMQGILSNPESELDYEGNWTLPQALAGCAAKVAHALVEKMKEERK